ncbi:hypothetical protein IKF84_00075 [Candidatus Saccharibacteria bacterium]|nr:hypothetical protein [Candidatus Saccharibacteria bacterium]
MYFDNLSEILEIAGKTGTAIFVVPDKEKIEIKNAFILEPEEKTVITIEQVRKMIDTLTTKQDTSRFVVIRPADKLSEEAENAILKSLEEPKENVHFVLVTESLSKLLPTILSRAAIYFWKDARGKISEISADEKTKMLAKKLLTVNSRNLVDIAEELTAKKGGVREHVLNILSITIEMAYKSYLLTGKTGFLNKIPKFLAAYDNIAKNGHIKLHLVADLL